MSYPPKPVVHLELRTGNLARACLFYERLLGWRPERVHAGGGSYLAMETGGEVSGGVVESEAARALWLPYVEADDVVDHRARPRARGGCAAAAAGGACRLARRGERTGRWGARLLAAQTLIASRSTIRAGGLMSFGSGVRHLGRGNKTSNPKPRKGASK
jgi:predicted enzyme related to lactoylglutathione lyase